MPISNATIQANADKFIKVNSGGTDVEFVAGSGGADWGGITGTLANQTDLQGALDAKTTLTAVKADTDIADAITKKHANTLDHSQNTDTNLNATFEAALKNTDNHTSGSVNKVYTATEQSKLAGIDYGAQANNISDVNATDLTDGGATTLHSHAGGGQAFPVGSVFIAVVDTNPATLLGYGTWSAFGTGRVLVGIDTGDTDFDTVEETGGAKTVTLTTAMIPAHQHVIPDVRSATTGSATTQIARTSDTSSTVGTDVKTASDGGTGGAHANVQPYIVVYMWKRTA